MLVNLAGRVECVEKFISMRVAFRVSVWWTVRADEPLFVCVCVCVFFRSLALILWYVIYVVTYWFKWTEPFTRL